jgi:penicillin-binding protein 1A
MVRGIVTFTVGAAALGLALYALFPAMRQLAFGTTVYGSQTPDLDPLAQRSAVYWADGSIMTELFNVEDRDPVELDAVPQHLIDAVIAIEDRDFFEHEGIDWLAIARAVFRDLEGEGYRQGGSTITQQLVKVTQFPDAERDLEQKAREAVIAFRLEQAFTKEEILERYLNTVYFGRGAYGVKAAAERYFNAPLPRLDVAQSALLAGLIRSPVELDPIDHPERARDRREQVLSAMVETGVISRAQARNARRAGLPTKVFNSARYAPDSYFVAAMIDYLVEQDNEASRSLGPDPATRRGRLYRGGLRITTTLDPAMQAQGELAVRTILPPGTPITGALVALDTASGQVRAMVGGIDYKVSKYNLATQGARQPGSSFKTFVLATALEHNYSPNDTILGESRCSFPKPIATTPPDPYVVSAHGGGVMSLRTAIAESINCAFVRLIVSLGHGSEGPAKVVELARRLGITRSDLVPVTSLALGTSGVAPIEMATAYATIAADGTRHDPEFVQKITDASGTILYRADRTGTAVLPPQIARTLTQMLTGPVRNGTAANVLGGFPRPAAGKTGTTDSNVDAWFVGYTPQLTAAVWIGQPNCGDNDNPACSMTPFIGSQAFGGRYPAQIWGAFMSAALEGQPVVDFTPPDDAQIPSSQYITVNGRLARIDPDFATPTSTTSTTAAPVTTTTGAPPTTVAPTTTVPPTTAPPPSTTTTVPGP